MSFQELTPPTLADVSDALTVLEKKYFSTKIFLKDATKAASVDDDDAQEWRYLLMQRRAIIEHRQRRFYVGVSKEKLYSAEDERNAQVVVAA